MKHIAFAVIAAAALAVIGPRIARDNPQAPEAVTSSAQPDSSSTRAVLPRGHAGRVREIRPARDK